MPLPLYVKVKSDKTTYISNEITIFRIPINILVNEMLQLKISSFLMTSHILNMSMIIIINHNVIIWYLNFLIQCIFWYALLWRLLGTCFYQTNLVWCDKKWETLKQKQVQLCHKPHTHTHYVTSHKTHTYHYATHTINISNHMTLLTNWF